LFIDSAFAIRLINLLTYSRVQPQPLLIRVQYWDSRSLTHTIYVTKHYNLVPVQAGEYADTPCNTLDPCPWSCSFGWCLAEDQEIGDQHRRMSWMAREGLYQYLRFTYLLNYLLTIAQLSVIETGLIVGRLGKGQWQRVVVQMMLI